MSAPVQAPLARLILAEKNVPEAELTKRLSQVWPAKPRETKMTRQADGTWNVTVTYD
jgi:hypothetical protein